VEANISVKAVANVQVLNKRNGYLAPHFYEPGEKIRIVDVKGAIKANRKRDGTLLVIHFEIGQMGIRQRRCQLIAAEVLQVHTVEKQQVGKFDAIDGAQTVQLKNAGH